MNNALAEAGTQLAVHSPPQAVVAICGALLVLAACILWKATRT